MKSECACDASGRATSARAATSTEVLEALGFGHIQNLQQLYLLLGEVANAPRTPNTFSPTPCRLPFDYRLHKNWGYTHAQSCYESCCTCLLLV